MRRLKETRLTLVAEAMKQLQAAGGRRGSTHSVLLELWRQRLLGLLVPCLQRIAGPLNVLTVYSSM